MAATKTKTAKNESAFGAAFRRLKREHQATVAQCLKAAADGASVTDLTVQLASVLGDAGEDAGVIVGEVLGKAGGAAPAGEVKPCVEVSVERRKKDGTPYVCTMVRTVYNGRLTRGTYVPAGVLDVLLADDSWHQAFADAKAEVDKLG